MLIKNLPAKFAMSDKRLPYYYNDEWLSNGAFAIKRCNVKNSERYCYHTDSDMQDIERVIPVSLEGRHIIRRTERLIDGLSDKYIRIFVDDSGNEYLVDEAYTQAFDLRELYATEDYSVLVTEAIDFVIMPIRKPKQ